MSDTFDSCGSLTALVRLATPVRDADLARLVEWPSSASLVDSFDAVAAVPARKRVRRRKTLVLTLVAALVLGGASLAAAAALNARTGIFGSEGATENDTSEWLDSKARGCPGSRGS